MQKLKCQRCKKIEILLIINAYNTQIYAIMQAQPETRLYVQPTLFDRRYSVFKKTIGNAKIENYFGISCNEGDKLSVTFDRHQHTNFGFLNIQYFTKNKPFNLSGLPISVCSHILSFASNTIQLKIKIIFPSTYPFTPPIWKLEEEKNTMCLSPEYNLRKYYEDITNRHNEIYLRKTKVDDNDRETNWTPAIGIDSDILYFLEKINHFDAIAAL